MAFVSILTVAVGAARAGGPFPAQGVQMLSWIPLAQFGPQQSNGSDCWGYVSPSGREYAIMGLRQTTAYVEITDPANPVIVAQINHPPSLWSDEKVFGHYAYVVTEGGGGVQVIDLSQIDAGVVTLVGSFTPMGLSSAHNIAIDEQSGFAYLAGVGVLGNGMMILDLANPEAPTFAGSWDPGLYVHDIQAVTYTTGPMAGHQIAFCSSGSGGLVILDTTDKANIQLLSSTQYPTLGFAHQGWLSGDRQRFYLDDESDEANGLVPTTTTYVFDVSDLSAPFLASTFTSGEQSIDHNLYIRDGVIYEANYTSGLRIFDARTPNDPLSPPQVGFFDTHPEESPAPPEHPNDPGQGTFVFDGAWSVFPFFPGGVVIVSDLNRGLFVLDVSGALGNTPGSADLNGDGVVDGADLASLLAQWGVCASCPADLNGDGVVDGSDLASLLTQWGTVS